MWGRRRVSDLGVGRSEPDAADDELLLRPGRRPRGTRRARSLALAVGGRDGLHTKSSDGTAWSGGGTSPSGYPVPDVLNARERRNYYVPQAVSSATSGAISTYEGDLKSDIYSVGAPLIGDAWETSTSQHHLVGHPTDRTIYHWFEIRGFQSSGTTTMYEDSVHNATSVSWYSGVPAYSSLPSSWVVSIVAGRGYVW